MKLSSADFVAFDDEGRSCRLLIVNENGQRKVQTTNRQTAKRLGRGVYELKLKNGTITLRSDDPIAP